MAGVSLSDVVSAGGGALALCPIPEHAQIYTEQRHAVKEYFQDGRNLLEASESRYLTQLKRQQVWNANPKRGA
jgi:hypothetical protein